MAFGDIRRAGADDDARSLGFDAARSLKTASSLTVSGNVDTRWVESKDVEQEKHRDQRRGAQSRLRCMPSSGLDATLRDIKAQLEGQDVPTRVYEDLLELHRTEFYCEEIRGRAWDLILAEMSRGRINGLIHVLRSWPHEDLVSFFTLVSSAEKTLWYNYPGTTLPTQWGATDKSMLVYRTENSFFYMVITILSDRRSVLDYGQVVQVIQQYPKLWPIALLFQGSKDRTICPNLQDFFTYLQTTYQDPLNLPDGLFPFIRECTAIRGAAVFFDRSDPKLVSGVVDRLLHTIRLNKVDRFLPSNFEPPKQPPPAASSSFESRHLVLNANLMGAKAHPSSPFLSFAVCLAYESRTAARMLLERGITRLVEQLYDSYDDERDAWIDGASAHGYLIMLQYCYLLLSAASKHCDLSVYVVKDELSEHLRQRSRALSERWFGVMWCD